MGQESVRRGLAVRIRLGEADQGSNAAHPLALLCPRGKRPCRHRAAEKRDELAPSHSITSSATARSLSGTSIPSALAVLRLITKENFVGCTTGKSVGLAPFKTRSA